MPKSESKPKKREEKTLQSFFFPTINDGVTIRAETREEAEKIAHKLSPVKNGQ